MNKTTRQAQQKETKVLNAAQSLQETTQATQLNSVKQESLSSYTPDSLWSNIKYGLGMLAIIVIPPLIPGTSVRTLIMAYMAVVIGIYLVAGIIAAARARHPTRNHVRGDRR